MRFNYQSMVTPSSVYDYDVASRQRKLQRQEVLGGYDPSRYEAKRLWAVARDGTKVPISVVHRKGVALDGKAPLLLYGYGSTAPPRRDLFVESSEPARSRRRLRQRLSAAAARWARIGASRAG